MVENSETHIITIFILIMSLVCMGAAVVMVVMPKLREKDEIKQKEPENDNNPLN